MNDAPTAWTSLIAIPISSPGLHLGVFFVHDLLRLDRHVDDVGCETIGETRIYNAYQCHKKLKDPGKYNLPDNRDLSLSILPMEIRRIDSGLDGLASHSKTQSVSRFICHVVEHHITTGFILTFPPVSQYEFLQFI